MPEMPPLAEAIYETWWNGTEHVCADYRCPGCVENASEALAVIQRRLDLWAESYWRDAMTFREDGDTAMAVAYETISRELRRGTRLDGPDLCFVLTEDNGSFCGRERPCLEHSQWLRVAGENLDDGRVGESGGLSDGPQC